MDNVVDITKTTEPISLARGMIDRAPEAVAGVAILVRADGSMWSDCCGHQKKDILWALERMKLEILMDGL